MPATFPLVDVYLRLRLGAEIGRAEPGHPLIVESPRRLRCEPSYGFVHALWAVAFSDGRCIVSVPPGAGAEVQELWAGATALEPMDDQRPAGRIRRAVNQSLMANGLDSQDGEAQTSLLFACNAALLQRHAHASCRRLTGDGIPAAEGIWLPNHCFPDGIVFGVIEDERVVSVAYAHRTELMEDQIADIGVETSPAYRRRGYARAVVSAVIGVIALRGGQAVYGCSPDNAASIATAKSCGCALHASSRALILRADGAG